MNPALLYRPRRRCFLWIAFACAAAIHIGAVVLAKSKPQKSMTQDFRPPGVEVEVIDTEPESPPEESFTTPPAQIPPDEDVVPEENRRPQPVRPRKRIRAISLTRGTVASFGSVKAMVMYAPRPVYPYEARRQRITGSGTALLTVNSTAGNVTSARMTQSCGNIVLDNATLDALRRWRFKPGSALCIEVPITYTLTGVSY